MKKIQLTLLLTLFVFTSITIIGQSRATKYLDCPGGTGSQDKIDLGEMTSESTDLATAKQEYGAYVTGKTTNLKCTTRSKCDTGNRCKKKTTGVGVNGTMPNPTQTVSGEWEFPAQASTTVFVKCSCILPKITIFEDVEIVDDEYEVNPLIGGGNSSNESVSVYPNPTRDQLNISIKDSDLVEELTVFIHNGMGQQIRKLQIEPSEDALKTINTSYYTPGIYFLTIIEGDKLISKSKFVVAEE